VLASRGVTFYLSATYVRGRDEIHDFDPCYPGPIPELSWDWRVLSGDTPWKRVSAFWSNGHNVTLFHLEDRGTVLFWIYAHDLYGETIVTSE
jgi:hypothetical protein